jgi:hypothetical protein
MSLQPSAFLESIIAFLMPYFSAFAADADAARNEIIETLASYATRTRAEMLHAAQIAAFGMSTLDTLAEAKAADMSLSMRLRYRGCANGLDRSCKHHETALDRRLACDPPMAAESAPEPVNDLPDAEAQRILEAAQTAIASHRGRLAPKHSAPNPSAPEHSATHPHASLAAGLSAPEQEWRNMKLSADAMMNALKQMGVPVDAAPGG